MKHTASSSILTTTDQFKHRPLGAAQFQNLLHATDVMGRKHQVPQTWVIKPKIEAFDCIFVESSCASVIPCVSVLGVLVWRASRCTCEFAHHCLFPFFFICCPPHLSYSLHSLPATAFSQQQRRIVRGVEEVFGERI